MKKNRFAYRIQVSSRNESFDTYIVEAAHASQACVRAVSIAKRAGAFRPRIIKLKALGRIR